MFPLDEEALATLLAGLDRAALRAMRPAARAAFERRFALERLVRELAGHVHALAANRL
ncbi:hypothetical protein [Jannaschia sp. W003]|uniref:hypothetical protein n=1 Tax=Jannaschia sp. W003 TaxID=2867012 RepID=UPI0021A6670D|nr:hypothetical protein [Jannaschia sp. W003]UWQ23196.1 hypothetical protein K3554_16785 [Jannaschia sp. W003]